MLRFTNIKKLTRLLWLFASVAIGSVNMLYSNDSGQSNEITPQTVKADTSSQQLQGAVEVSFKITEEGKADIISIESENPALIEYVKKKLNKIQLQKDDINLDEVITYRFIFGKNA